MKQLDINLMHPSEQINVIIGRIYRSGMTTTSGGNISIKDANGDIWITPSGVDKGSLTVKDIILIKKDGSIVGPHKPFFGISFSQGYLQSQTGTDSHHSCTSAGISRFQHCTQSAGYEYRSAGEGYLRRNRFCTLWLSGE